MSSSTSKLTHPAGGPGPAGIPSPEEPVRTGLGGAAIRRDFSDNLFYIQARFPEVASLQDFYQALAYTVRDRMLERWIRAAQRFKTTRARTVCYLSAEFLPGPHLGINLLNLGITEEVRRAMAEVGLDLDVLTDQEEEPGLGSGGLGRLAACYLDALAALEVPAIGYGIRYEFGIFDQRIVDGWQVEVTDKWLRYGNPWEIPRPGIDFEIKLGGHTEAWTDDQGRYRVRWIPGRVVRGVAYDTPILGFRVESANLLRLWSAEAPESFDFGAFNQGDYYRAVEQKVASESVTKILYPNDEPAAGKRLRLEQQYFLVSCALQDMIRIHRQTPGVDFEDFRAKYAVQLNDTHGAVAVAELMRLLVDEYCVPWEQAWSITTRVFGYTNHTLLPEALESWSLDLFGEVLPRPLEIIREIDRRFLDEVRIRYPGDEDRLRRVSVVDEHGSRRVRMAHLACVGSHAINGVAAMHTDLLERTVLGEFHALWPERFSNQTNGVSPRRFLMLANPELSALLDETLGQGWRRDLETLRALEPYAEDASFRETWRRARLERKRRLAEIVSAEARITLDPEALLDAHVKRIHEYKRQHLNLLGVITAYLRLKHRPDLDAPPRSVLFAGKAAPGYRLAKLIIRLIHAVAEVINRDPAMDGRLRVAFLPDFNVKRAQAIYPAGDLSEQISTAGKEASGTGNMKFAMNGALTIGTLDGANVELRDAVGPENFFRFGCTVEDVASLRAEGYRPWELCERDEELREAIELIRCGFFSHGDGNLFRPLLDSLLGHDEYLVLADYRSYVDCQQEVGRAWMDREDWTRRSILNVARIGRFSADAAIRGYCRDIWRVEPAPAGRAKEPD